VAGLVAQEAKGQPEVMAALAVAGLLMAQQMVALGTLHRHLQAKETMAGLELLTHLITDQVAVVVQAP
jgi:hypothetical protein